MLRLICFSIMVSSVGCATPQGRFLVGATTGGIVAGSTAAVLSPNRESVGMNALVFGLSGALVGGVGSLLWGKTDKIPDAKSSLEAKELQSTIDFVVPGPRSMPEFLKQRIKPAVIEEYQESDSIAEDGTLHEPHKVYRIKRPAELISRPHSARSGRTQ